MKFSIKGFVSKSDQNWFWFWSHLLNKFLMENYSFCVVCSVKRCPENFSQNSQENTCAGISFTAQKLKFSIKDFSSKCEQIHSFLQIWSLLLKKILNGKHHFLGSVFQLSCRPNASGIPQKDKYFCC